MLVATILFGQDKEAYILQYRDIAISEMHRTGIPASIKLSQAVLESRYGKSELAMEAHNHFGIKCGREWGGKGYHLKDDDHDVRGELVHSCFRVFTSPEESYIAHSDFLADPAKSHRYGALFSLAPDDYKGWAEGLKRGGYATNPEYARLLIRIIEEQKLYQYDVSRINESLATHHVKNKYPDLKRENNNATVDRHSYLIQFQNDIPYVTALSGDNVKNLSKRMDVPAGRIIRYNEFVDNRRTQLQEGDRIYLQPLKRKYRDNQRVHIVKEGETMKMIAHFYGVKSDILRKRNNVPDGCEPAAGTQIVLRGRQNQSIRCASDQQSIIATSTPKRNAPTEKPTSAKPQAHVAPTPDPKIERETQPEQVVLQATAPDLPATLVQQMISYTVQPKDTLYQIATKHGISIVELKKLNNLSTDTIHPGQTLKVQK
jgi:LysM repeat protein